jgi:uncharacterized protein (TIGR02996 family)
MSTPLSDEDKAFIRAILNNPAELTGWLAYADWLDERDDPRAEFVRLHVQLLSHERRREPTQVQKRLEELRQSLDPNWLAVFERAPIENCDDEFAFKCPKKWEQLKGTDNPRVRHCDTCEKQVYFCLTLGEARERTRLGLCVAISPALRPPPVTWPLNPREGHITMGVMRMPDPDPEPAPRRPWWKFW